MFDAAVREFEFYCRVERRLALNTVEAYRGDLHQFRIEIGADIDLRSALSVPFLKSFLETIVVEKRLSVSTAKRRFACLRAFAKFVCCRFDVDDPFLVWQPKLKRPKRLPRSISRQEFSAFVSDNPLDEEIERETVFCMLLLGATGLRVSELCDIKTSDVDAEGTTIRVNGKGSKERIVFVSHRKLSSELSDRRERRLELGGAQESLLRNSRDKALKPQTLRRRIHKLRQNRGIKNKVTPHMLRHTAATLLIEGGTDIRFVQRLLGHASISTTEIYTHVNDVALKKEIMKANVISEMID